MLTHIVLWKYKPDVDEEQRENHRARLRDLKNSIPEVVSMQVGADMIFLPRSYDTGLIAVFQDRAALEIYNAHSLHQEVVAIGRAIAEHVASVDFVE